MSGEALTLTEAFRGDVLIWLRINDGFVDRCHIRDASWFQWPLLEAVIEGNIVADFPSVQQEFQLFLLGTRSVMATFRSGIPIKPGLHARRRRRPPVVTTAYRHPRARPENRPAQDRRPPGHSCARVERSSGRARGSKPAVGRPDRVSSSSGSTRGPARTGSVPGRPSPCPRQAILGSSPRVTVERPQRHGPARLPRTGSVLAPC